MQRFLFSFVLAVVLAPITQAADERRATIVDVGGTETRLVEFTTDHNEFGGIAMGSPGIPIVIKDFRVRDAPGAAYRRWMYLDDIEQIEFKQRTVTVRLKTGAIVAGSFGSINPDYVQFTGKSEFGELSLPADKVRTVTVTAAGTPRSAVDEIAGANATITLRDGTVLAAKGVQRHCFFSSQYINVRGTDAHYSSVWVRFKRGEASVETELPFTRIREITFDAPVVTSTSYSGGTGCKVTLRDGAILSGDCHGGETARGFDSLVGRTAEGPFEIVRDLAYAIKTIQFSE